MRRKYIITVSVVLFTLAALDPILAFTFNKRFSGNDALVMGVLVAIGVLSLRSLRNTTK
jgi:hypothetical protein